MTVASIVIVKITQIKRNVIMEVKMCIYKTKFAVSNYACYMGHRVGENSFVLFFLVLSLMIKKKNRFMAKQSLFQKKEILVLYDVFSNNYTIFLIQFELSKSQDHHMEIC